MFGRKADFIAAIFSRRCACFSIVEISEYSMLLLPVSVSDPWVLGGKYVCDESAMRMFYYIFSNITLHYLVGAADWLCLLLALWFSL